MSTLNPDRFKQIQEYINEYTDANGCAPILDEISAATGIPKTSVHRYIHSFCERGEMIYSGPRNLSFTKNKAQTVRVPVLGEIACGIPKFAQENIEEYLKLPVSLFGEGNFFILRAYGDSMIEAGINDGDMVVIRRQDTASPGQIVVALVDDDEATLKRYYPEPKKRRVRLHPENRTMEDIIVPDCTIQGVAVKVLKDLE